MVYTASLFKKMQVFDWKYKTMEFKYFHGLFISKQEMSNLNFYFFPATRDFGHSQEKHVFHYDMMILQGDHFPHNPIQADTLFPGTRQIRQDVRSALLPDAFW